MLDKVVKDAQDWNLTDALLEDILTIGHMTTMVNELSEWFAGTSDFDEELFDFIAKWTEKYMEEASE